MKISKLNMHTINDSLSFFSKWSLSPEYWWEAGIHLNGTPFFTRYHSSLFTFMRGNLACQVTYENVLIGGKNPGNLEEAHTDVGRSYKTPHKLGIEPETLEL